MKIYLKLNTNNNLNMWFFKIFAHHNNYEIEVTKNQSNPTKNYFQLSHIPTFNFVNLNFKVFNGTLTRDNIPHIFASSYLVKLDTQEHFLLNYFQYWSNINQIKKHYFISFYGNQHIKSFDGRQKDKNYEIAKILKIKTPNVFMISRDIHKIFDYIIKHKLKNFVLKPNYLDTGKNVYINPTQPDFQKIYEELKNINTTNKELLIIITENERKIMIEQEIKNSMEIKLYIFGGEIKFILFNKKMHNKNLVPYCMDKFKNGELRLCDQCYTKINQVMLKNMKQDSISMYNYFNDFFNKNIFTYFLRVDFLVTTNDYYFNEFCLFPNGGNAKSFNKKMDRIWGNYYFGL